MRKLMLLILVSVVVYRNNVKECLDGDVKACGKVAHMTFSAYDNLYEINKWRQGGYPTPTRNI